MTDVRGSTRESLNINPSTGYCFHYQINTILCIKLADETTPESFYRISRYIHGGSYFQGTHAARNGPQHLQLTVGRLVLGRQSGRTAVKFLPDGFKTGTSICVTGQHTRNSRLHLTGVGTFQQNGIDTTLSQTVDHPNFFVHGVDDDTGIGIHPLD